MIQFHALRFKNFLSSGNDFSTIKLGAADLTMIIGRNGAGKSTMIDAICFALYGKPFRKITKPQLVNSVNKKACEVQIAFSIGNKTYTVRRGIKPNLFEIYEDKVLLPEDPSVGDYQKQLDAILNVTYKTFCQVNILGKASYIPFMSLPAASRREVVEDLLDSHVYSVMLGFAKAEQTDLNRSIKDLDSDIRVVKAKIDAQIKLIARQNDDKTAQIQAKQGEIAKYNEDRQKFVDASLKGTAAQEKARADWLEARQNDPADEIMSIRQRIAGFNNEITRVSSVWTKIEHMTNCPTCSQGVSGAHKDGIAFQCNSTIEVLKEDKAVEEAKLPDLIAIQQDIQAKADKLNDITEKLSGVTTKIAMFDNAISIAQSHLDKLLLPNPSSAGDQEELEDLQNNEVITTTRYNNTVKELSTVKNCIALLGDDGIKAKLVSKYIPIINKYINEYLESMDLFVQFELDEQFNETIKSRYRDIFSYESFSEGEKARVDLAILLTWRKIAKLRNSTISNILILDETLDGSMDTSGSGDFLNLLRATVDTQNAFIISHNQSVIDGFDNIIVAEKVGNFTEYTIQGRDD